MISVRVVIDGLLSRSTTQQLARQRRSADRLYSPHQLRPRMSAAQAVRGLVGGTATTSRSTLAWVLNICWSVRRSPMTEALHPIQVVVAYDFSPSSEQALARAIEVAARAPQHVLHIVAALDPHDRLAGPFANTSYLTAEEIHTSIRKDVSKAFAGRDTAAEIQFYVHARIGKPAEEILALASEVGADLIFIGSHGKTGLERLVLGSVSERVVREAKCPVLVARAKTYPTVELLHVSRYEHARPPHRGPHCYAYANRQVITRPKDWPLS
jgi:nucleotide-binding universal stress UspA family protein